MSALFAATVRAPLTGIALVAEMTGQSTMLLRLNVTCTTASLMAEGCGGRPIYAQLLERTLERAAAETRFKQPAT